MTVCHDIFSSWTCYASELIRLYKAMCANIEYKILKKSCKSIRDESFLNEASKPQKCVVIKNVPKIFLILLQFTNGIIFKYTVKARQGVQKKAFTRRVPLDSRVNQLSFSTSESALYNFRNSIQLFFKKL